MRPADVTAAVLVALAPSLARAHEVGLSYGEFVVRDDRVGVALRLSAAEVEASIGHLDVVESTAGMLRVARGDAPCAFVRGDAAEQPSGELRVTAAFECTVAGGPLAIDAEPLLSRMPWGHTHLAKVVIAGRTDEHVLRSGRETILVDAPAPWRPRAMRFVRLGVEHIFTGLDHIAFVIGLVLLGGTLRQLAAALTSFTLAHSVILAVASLRIVELPPALVEPLIAASIICIAVENLRGLSRESAPRRARRCGLAFAFGLVHGFGFAGALTDLNLTTAGMTTALLSFNLGVELGQAAIVAAAFPLLGLIRRWPARAALVLRAGSAAIGVAGAFWLVQRVAAPGTS